MLSGCAGIGVIETSDPAVKLSDAGYLQDRDRPLIAERLIREATEIYQSKNDQLGLAKSNMAYGHFFMSPTLEGKWSTFYRERGFIDKSATYDSRYEKAIEYFEKALPVLRDHQKYDKMTNAYANEGFVYVMLGKREAACQAFDKSLQSYHDNIQQNPEAKPIAPQGFGSFEEYLTYRKKVINCK